MPIDRKRYPPDWKQTSFRIRFERAGGKCEWPGCGAVHGEPHPVTGKKVKLQTAHLNRDPEQTRDEDLMAMCARCHFAYDRADNQAKRKYGKLFKESGYHPDLFSTKTARLKLKTGCKVSSNTMPDWYSGASIVKKPEGPSIVCRFSPMTIKRSTRIYGHYT